MKNFKYAILVVASLGLAGVAGAQSAGPTNQVPVQQPAKRKHISHAEMAKLRQDSLNKANLSGDQKAKVKAHEEKTKQELKDLRKSMKGASRAERQAKKREIREANKKFLKETLTKQQLREYNKARKEQLKKIRDGGKASG